MLLVDADGNLVFFNEPAERILGRPYAEAQMSSRGAREDRSSPSTRRARRSRSQDLPLATAFRSGIPSHGHLRIEAVDGRTA